MNNAELAFDQYASEYDVGFTNTWLGKYYRYRVQERMKYFWYGRKKILELNSGTGEDALFLAKMGNEVLATDISNNMLNVASQKAERFRCKHRVRTKHLAIENLDQLNQERFDGILSNFGGLNCVKDFDQFAINASNLLVPNGTLMICVMGPYVPWEWFWYGVKGKFKKAFRRLPGETVWRNTKIYYPSVGKVKDTMENASFKLISTEALGVFMPPSYVSHTVDAWPKTFRRLAIVEKRLSKIPLISNLADHYLMVFKKVAD